MKISDIIFGTIGILTLIAFMYFTIQPYAKILDYQVKQSKEIK